MTVTPEEPVQGDEITILVEAAPNKEIDVKISFGETVQVFDGEYEFKLEDVQIPPPQNSFTVKANNVKNLKVSVKIIIWITKSDEADDGKATVSQSNVPSGKYNIKISGDALEDAKTVSLEVTASTKITTDENGLYEYTYDTSSIPSGEFIADVDGKIKIITLSEPGPPPPPKPKPDKTPPTITDPKPTGIVNNPAPSISANYTDNKKIDVKSVSLELDGADVTENAIVTTKSVMYALQPLANATTHQVELAVADTSGNAAALTWNFTIALPPPPNPPPHMTPPTITDPKPTGTINTSMPTISAYYADDEGIDTDTVRLELDSVDITNNTTITPEMITYASRPLANAVLHLVKLTVADTSGEEATLTWNFTVLFPGTSPPPPRSAQFDISNLVVTPAEVEVGDVINVSVLVSNVGEQQGNHTVTLHVGSSLLDLVDESNVTLEEGASETVTFTVVAEEEGTYSVEVEGLTEGFTAVVRPPQPEPYPYTWISPVIIILIVMTPFLIRKYARMKWQSSDPTRIFELLHMRSSSRESRRLFRWGITSY